MSFNRFPIQFGKYIILDRVSGGGMAEIYRAKEAREGISRLVAIKRMSNAAATDPEMVPMFVDEAKVASRLTHPNIAQTVELGRIDEALYIAMELVWGRDLNAIIKSCRAMRVQLPHALTCYIVSKAAEALDYAHNALGPDGRPMRLVHRDVSPHNVMVDYEGEVKLIDFGIAKADSRSNKTAAGIIKGKFAYMAPEQAAGGNIDRRADIFALGILLYELLSGERAFDGSSAFSIFDKVANHQPPRLSDVAVVPEALDAVVSRCLAKNPTERFETASQLADALAPFRIVNGGIVGRREARDLMQQLFPGDVASMQDRLRHYATVTATDCINASSLLRIPRTQVLVAAELISNAFNELHREAKTTLYEATPRRRLTPDTIPITKPFEMTVIEPLPPASWPTVLVITLIALIAATIIVAARSRNQTAFELFESLWRGYTYSQNVEPSLDTKTLVGPKGRAGDKLSER
ncbi:MAG: serine/threonine protein kinase [Myxococcota bacterium]